MTLDVHIRHGLPQDLIPQAARLYWQAFQGQLGLVLGPEPLALAFLRRAIRPEFCLAAQGVDGRLLALAGIGGPEGGFAGGRREDLTGVYGNWGAFWRGGLLAALPRDENPARFLIDGLIVHPECQGLGIGSRLIAEAEILARTRGHAQIQIDVAAENLRARELYQRRGYRQASAKSTGPLRLVFGITATLAMVKDLT
jgi:ribosomal protein S18 acetylase RimI-like enzyme